MSFALPWLLAVLPLAVAAALLAVRARARRRRQPARGTRLANTVNFAALPGYAAVARQHHLATALGVAFGLVAAAGAVVLAARPVQAEVITPQNRARDVVLCLDVSGSMYPVDAQVIGQFRQIVAGFDGERVAMSWFNSSSVTLFPLTDDYTFIEDTLGPLEDQFEAITEALTWDDWMEMPAEEWPDDSGTLLGEGSSLPGDGLVSCLSLFDDVDTKRSRSVIFATDNVVEGVPIFELAESTQMAADADVHVYALCPEAYGVEWSLDEQEFARAADELRSEVERAGGDFYEIGRRSSVSEIIESILAQAAGPVDEAPRRILHDRPGWGIGLLVVGLAGVAVWGGWRVRPWWPTWLRRGSLLALTGVIVWNPTFGVEDVTIQAADADVLVLVDTSPSAAAEDWDGSAPRLDGVKSDLAALASHYAGSHIAIMTFDSSARLLMPLSTDPGAALAAAETLTPLPAWRASGSSISAALPLLLSTLERLAEEHPERARLVYYLGDGEQTTDEPVEDFAAAAGLIDGGAVFGYGTAQGGKMLEHQETVMGEPVGPAEYIRGPDGELGVSRIDEDALRQVASGLGVEYVHRTASDPVAQGFWAGELPQRTLADEASLGRPVGFLVALPALALLVWELALAFGRAGRAKAASASGARARWLPRGGPA
ncbi:MAG: VWA domain-containing protein [Bifidobacteriaceae bacterium]|nr:VWA domain-containing protein [Bifidobacteriaceae bacterium]